jgi:hypothetical protein
LISAIYSGSFNLKFQISVSLNYPVLAYNDLPQERVFGKSRKGKRPGFTPKAGAKERVGGNQITHRRGQLRWNST